MTTETHKQADATRVAEDKARDAAENERGKVRAKFATQFQLSARMAVTALQGNASATAKLVVIAWKGDLFDPQRVQDYCLGIGEFVKGTAKSAFRIKFCRQYAPLYCALTVARDTLDPDGAKMKATVSVAVSGVEGHMTVKAIRGAINGIESIANSLVLCMGAIDKIGNVERVFIRKNGELAIAQTADKDGNAEQAHYTAAELSRQAPKTEADSRGKQLEKGMALPIGVVTECLTKLLLGMELDGLPQKDRDSLSLLMAVMINMHIPAQDESGNTQPVTLAA